MDPIEAEHKLDANTQMAAERTLLAWVRTGLSMIGLGFVVARFGMFLRESEAAHGVRRRTPGLSVWAGVALVLLGVLVNVLASAEHTNLLAKLDRGERHRATRLSLRFLVPAAMAIFGLALASYLVWMRTG